MGKHRECVEHVTQAATGGAILNRLWPIVTSGRTLASGVLASLIGGGIFSWWQQVKGLMGPWGLGIILTTCLILTSSSLWLLAREWNRRVLLGKSLHQVNHVTRDTVLNAKEISVDTGGKLLRDPSHEQLRMLCSQIANRIKEYFRLLTKEPSVECSIRLAERAQGREVVYSTLGRSDGFNPNREQTTEAIPGNTGIPAFLSQKEQKGVLIYYDLEEASRHGLYLKTRNDTLYSQDVKTLMVAPINGLDTLRKKDRVMVGLLYVTSTKDPFRHEHAEPLSAFADMLGTAVPQIIEFICDKRFRAPG